MNDSYKYTVELTRLINERIKQKEVIKEIGNDVFKLNLTIGKIKKQLAKTEKEIDKTVTDYNKK